MGSSQLEGFISCCLAENTDSVGLVGRVFLWYL